MSKKSVPGDGSHGKGDKGLAAQRRGRTPLMRNLVTGMAGLLGHSAGTGR